MNNDFTYSDYWLDDIEELNFDSDDSIESALDLDMIRLASAKRAISNFVQILTNKNIPVYFNSKDINCTDGKNVYISADIIKKNDFDPAVGLALHEGSHILLTDFDIPKTIWMHIPREIYDITEKKGIAKNVVATTIKDIWNIVEDRYVDNFIYKNAPGYRGYYHALYNKYFHSSVIDTMLQSNMYRKPSIKAYCARICNIMNKNTDLNALPDFLKIAELLDLTHIDRLKNPKDRIELAYEISQIIFKNAGEEPVINDMVKSETGDKSIGELSDKTDGKEEKTNSEDDVLGGEKTEVNKPVDKTNDEKQKDIENDEGDTSEISTAKLNRIRKALERQQDFLKGEINKKKVTAYQKNILDAIEKSGMVIEKVGKDVYEEHNKVSGIDCIVVKNLTKELILSDEFPMSIHDLDGNPASENVNIVKQGILMGCQLGKKLLLRNENNTTKHMRKSDGKIDKRIIAELGFNNDRIFCTQYSEKYDEAYIHISVDASSSMDGNKWKQTMIMTTAICKACNMIENVKVTVSFRTTISTKGRTGNIPYVVFAYDSSKDKFSKVYNLFPYLIPNGMTPEGLAYEAIMNICKEQQQEHSCYFLNLSDGIPYMPYLNENYTYTYSGDKAVNHTKRQVSRIKEKNYKILSYFIKNCDNDEKAEKQFKIMYGQDARFIDTNNINSIARTINEMFLKKDL
jgi:hypothetical protein